MYIKTIKELVLSIFFPRSCYGCGSVGEYLCEFCKAGKILYKNIQECHVCKKVVSSNEFVHEKCREKTALDGVIISLKYNKFVEHLIAEFKYEFISDLKNLLGKFLIEAFQKSKIEENLTLSFVPLHSKRKKWRGYNQSELLAEIFAEHTNMKLTALLERKKYEKSQVGLGRGERLKNVRNVFAIKYKEIPKEMLRKVLIIDDVMTTGATLEECAKVLKDAGVKKVYGLVIARG